MTDTSQHAGAPAAQPTFMDKFGKWVYAIVGFIFLAIGFMKVVDDFTLPSCNADRTTSTVRDIFKGKDVELVTLKDIKAVTDTRQEKTCTAYIESKDETANIDYKVFWDGWTVKVLIATVRDEQKK